MTASALFASILPNLSLLVVGVLPLAALAVMFIIGDKWTALFRWFGSIITEAAHAVVRGFFQGIGGHAAGAMLGGGSSGAPSGKRQRRVRINGWEGVEEHARVFNGWDGSSDMSKDGSSS